jgi:peroxiredoxin
MKNIKPIKNFIVENNCGDKVRLSDFHKSKKLLLVFFRGVWCQYCKKQLLDIQRHFAKIRKAGFAVLAVSNDNKLKSSLLKNFLQLDFPVISDEKMALINYFRLKTKYRGKVTAKPALFFFDNRQKLFDSYIGKKYDDRLSAKSILKRIKELKN